MLGNILGALTSADAAENMLASIGDPTLMERVRKGAEANGIPVGAFVVSTVRHLLDHGGEEVWLDLLRRMSDSPQPGAAALQSILARAFPDPAPVRNTRAPS